jgi:transaldolase
MNAPQKLHELGQSLCLDNITRRLLDSGTLRSCLSDYAVSGLTSNPIIFEKAIDRVRIPSSGIKRSATEIATLPR